MNKDQLIKALIIIWAILGLLFGASYAQSIKIDASGNYISTAKSRIAKDTVLHSTGKTYTDSKGITYPVYMTASNKLYVIRTSKNTGNKYKQYLKLE